MKKTRLYKKAISAFVVLLTMDLVACPVMEKSVAWTDSQKEAALYPSVEIRESFVFAQNEENNPADKKKNGSSSERNESDGKLETKRQKKDLPPGSKSKPLKDFVPSEEIAADQTVDFPYDI